MWQTLGRHAASTLRERAIGTDHIFLVLMAIRWRQVHKTAGCKYR